MAASDACARAQMSCVCARGWCAARMPTLIAMALAARGATRRRDNPAPMPCHSVLRRPLRSLLLCLACALSAAHAAAFDFDDVAREAERVARAPYRQPPAPDA